ncbi:MAG: tetratricopeptide repeat protein [Alphaproteobacteria bacterium]|nr:tetratricopeptide repeat protein [Alphaproteobacteria bacterium]
MEQRRSEKLADLSDLLAQAARQAQSGQLGEAERALRQILRVLPDQADVLNLLALVEHRSGRTDAAVRTGERALKLKPNVANSHANLAVMYRRLGNFAKAIEHARRATILKPDFADAHYNLGLAQFEAGDLDAAINSYDRAIALKGSFAEAINNRGVVFHKLGRLSDAEVEFRRALAQKPSYPEALNNLGTVLRNQNRFAEAVAAYQQAIALRPGYVDALKNLLFAYRDLGRPHEAIGVANEVLRLHPNEKTVLWALTEIYLDLQMPEESIVASNKLIALGDATAEIYERLGIGYARTADVESAVDAYRKAIALKPDFALAFGRLGSALSQLGRFDEAMEAFSRALQLDPTLTDIYLDIAYARTFGSSDDPDLKAMEAVRQGDLHRDRRVYLHFALGKAYDDLARYDEAFENFAAGNRLARETIVYDEARQLEHFDRTREMLSSEFMKANSGVGNESQRPIFVVGMARAGTTLVEQIIASHPDAHGAGEIADFALAVGEVARRSGKSADYPDVVKGLRPEEVTQVGETYVKLLERRAPGSAKRIVDKMPQNLFFIGLIHLALPNARIVHVTRDPLDTCLSCYSKLFASGWPQTYDLEELGRYYRAYRQLMAHWHRTLPENALFEIPYEELISDSEAWTRRLLNFCRLEWNDAVREFHNNKRPVKTISLAQVRRPIYRSSIGRWRNYEKHLGSLISALSG